ncbi:MAG: phosphocholine cytidylyltransferase/choline kinase family protein [Lachnospiraceae bacterium]|nr:phosphocholine cytidylyltransferase/choline kinase family protein [Lachnospiraceae bacterium]
MNKQDLDVLNRLYFKPYVNQRELAEDVGYSLGTVNHSLAELKKAGFLTGEYRLTKTAIEAVKNSSPKNAVILAAGYGMRMVPINLETPKAFLEVHGEAWIERLIGQLHEVGIEDITIVVGFLKEYFDYLVDKYGVKLVVNEEYASYNNLHSLEKVADRISNTYVVPCDIWCETNPFNKVELYSWYMVGDKLLEESDIRINRNNELVKIKNEASGNVQLGIAYLMEPESKTVRERLNTYSKMKKYDNAFWEETLYRQDKMIVSPNMVNSDVFIEINTYEQLRELDSGSNHLKSEAVDIAAKTLGVETKDIVDIEVLKKGMTNRSFLFFCKNQKYIMRIPGEGTEHLINRKEEEAVYNVIKDKDICDEVIYINAENGYKITKVIDGVRNCDPFNSDDVIKSMQYLRNFHEKKMTVPHRFDLFEKIDYYESLWENGKSIYRDYEITKKNLFSLKKYIDRQKIEESLTHIDAVPDNFLFAPDKDGKERIYLIDWEYAAMQDPHVDIAMFAIYSMYERKKVDELINAYFPEGCTKEIRLKIYCYIAVCGLLWSNWCEYKRALGVEFGEYSLKQYRYAKDYYKIVCEESEQDV